MFMRNFQMLKGRKIIAIKKEKSEPQLFVTLASAGLSMRQIFSIIIISSLLVPVPAQWLRTGP
jgi:hypothetical protein